ncbi:hypothetical protein ACSLBF_12505 [Pseudoalteromonas sp. T1lg65]|uniref:hypothetical protein n=1 Tax=Pseudoalteromonas sp. T1lg65 TaxID=2077101 RepID=UPI003F7A1853
MKKLYYLLGIGLLGLSSLCRADFDFKGEGTLVYPTGVEKEFEFGFAWNKANGKFRIGENSYDMSELPEAYSVALTLSKDNTKVWIQEFNQGFIGGFTWQIGNHTITLSKTDFHSSEVIGDYVLSVDGIDYFFTRSNVSITLSFSQDGIDNVKVDGVKKDMGTKS